MSKNQVNIAYYQFNIKLKLFNNSITKEKYAFRLYFYAFGQKPLTNIFISFLIKSNYSSKENILIKFKPKNSSEKSIDKIMEDCERYRKDLIRYCYQFFEYE